MGGDRHPDGVETYPATPEDLATYTQARAQLAAFQAPVLVDGDRTRERLFVAAFDGTGNSLHKDAPENLTNVARIREQVEALHKRGEASQIATGYIEGPGT